MSSTIRSPVFIVSRPRCGSTLLRSILSSHSQIKLVNEPDLIMAMRISGYTVDDTFTPFQRRRLLGVLNQNRGCRRHLQTLESGHIERFLSSKRTYTFKEVYEYLLPRPSNVTVWGDKTVGSSLLVVSDILDMYPDALVIHIIRDPRAVLLSTYRKRFAQSKNCLPPFCRESIAFFAYESMLWKASMDAMEETKRTYPSGSIYELAFEDLVSEPEQEIRTITSVIGVPFEQDMLDPTGRSADPVLKHEFAFAHQNLSKAIDSTRADGGSSLPAWASVVIQHCADNAYEHCDHQLKQRPSLYQRFVIRAGLFAYYGKMLKRLNRENQWFYRSATRGC